MKPHRDYFHKLVSFEEALKILSDKFCEDLNFPLPSERVSVRESLHRVSASPVFARFSSPYFHAAAMDGYAVKAKDTFGVTEKTPKLLEVGKEAVWIETGDPLPEGFDAVIPVEDTTLKDKKYIEIYSSVSPYTHVRPAGEDIVATELIIPENHIIRPVDIGALLASGVTEIEVRKKPKVGIIPTGSELILPEEAIEKGLTPPSLIEYNSSVISGLLKEFLAEPVVYPIIPDREEALRDILLKAVEECDLVLINAGSGYGEEDFTYKVLSSLGKIYINGVAIKPGKPFLAAIVKDLPVLGVPGYPVSTFFTVKIFVKKLLEKMLGVSFPEEEEIEGVLSRPLFSKLGIDEFVRVKVGKVKDKYVVSPSGRGAGLLMSVVRADGCLHIPANSEGYSQGEKVKVRLWRTKREIENTIVCIGSHDNVLDLIYNFLKKRFPEFSFSSAHVGSMGGLIAIKKGEAHVAGTHLIDEETGEYNVPFIKRILPEKKVLLVNLVYRLQGFIVLKGNPKNIQGVEDLTREDVKFINRQKGAGTRILLDKLLREKGISPERIQGYDREEYTHMGVAQAVASGMADVGLGIYAAAKALDLDFIPVVKERYDLLIPREFWETPSIQALMKILTEDKEFKEAVLSLGGYSVEDMGKIIYKNF